MIGSPMVSFGSPGETTSQADLEGTLSTLVQLEILDDSLLDSNNELVRVVVLEPGDITSQAIVILDNDSEYLR